MLRMSCTFPSGRLAMLGLLSLLTLASCSERGRLERENAALQEQISRDNQETRDLNTQLQVYNLPHHLSQAGPSELQAVKNQVASLVKDKEGLAKEFAEEQARLEALQTRLENYQRVHFTRRNP